jgi:hypothetical protein
VPLLLQSAQAEMDVFPLRELRRISSWGLRRFVAAKLGDAFGAAVAANATQRYLALATSLHEPAEFAAYALDADTGSGCGLRALATAAASGFASPVYLGTVVQPPANVGFFSPLAASPSIIGTLRLRARRTTFTTTRPRRRTAPLEPLCSARGPTCRRRARWRAHRAGARWVTRLAFRSTTTRARSLLRRAPSST